MLLRCLERKEQTTRTATVWVGTLIFCPVMRLKLSDLEVKVAEQTEGSGGEREATRRSEFGLRELQEPR